MKAHHWGGLVVTLLIGGVIGYYIGKNSMSTTATTPAAPAAAK
jgi:hypothetical protein